MRVAIAVVASFASLIASAAVPSVAAAQVWREDPCRSERHEAARNGTVAGGLFGALIGSQIAGRGNHTAGAIIGGSIGAAAGHQVGAHSVECRGYPVGYRHHRGCHWVVDSYRGRNRSYEICPYRDEWRAYGDY